jgi:putative transcription antitermination factor YqgF
MNYLGLDYGLKHVGVAISEGSLAEPLTTLPNNNLLTRLKQLIFTHKIHTVVIGQPTGPLASEVRELATWLTSLDLSVELVDETLSSQDATRLLLHASRKKRSTQQHAAAAAIILQSYLDALPTIPLS